jgi:hypothetical protein
MSRPSRDLLLFMARSLKDIGRPRDMMKFLRDAIGLNSRLLPDDRRLVGITVKQLVDPLRNSIKFVDCIIPHQVSKSARLHVLALIELRAALFRELSLLCYDLIGVFARQLRLGSKLIDDQVFYFTVEADLYRYICEFAQDADKWEPTNTANERYESAIELGREHLSPLNPILLNARMNFAVFTAEIMDHTQDAVNDLNNTLQQVEKAVADNQRISHEAGKIIKLIEKDIQIWQKRLGDEL